MYVLNQPFAPSRTALGYLGKIPLVNQAVARSIYYPPKISTTRVLKGLGQNEVTFNAPLMIGGAAALIAAFYFLGGRKGGTRGRRLRRLESKKERVTRQIRQLEAMA